MSTNWNLYEYRLTANWSNARNRNINVLQEKIKNKIVNSPSYHAVYINGSTTEKYLTINSVGSDLNKKEILSLPDETFNLGDLIVWDSNNWLVTEIDSDDQIYTKGIIEQCNYNLKFQDTNGQVLTYPVVFEQKSGFLDTGTNNIITTVDGKASIKCRFHSTIANLLVSGKRLMLDSRLPNVDVPNCYKITNSILQSYDGGTNGVLNINLEKDEYNASSDRKDLGICDYKTIVISTGTASITFTNDAVIKVGGSYKTFTFVCKNSSGTILSYTPTWTLASSTGSISNLVIIKDDINKLIKIKCNDVSSMIGTTLSLSAVAQEDSTYTSTLIIKVVSL